jgi:predicted aldo/keto reductase-like oxidoreductase
MKYRRFGTLDWKVSALGFGAMRLPIIGADRGNIDEAEAIRMIQYAFDHGVNYVDSAYPYHEGNSEIVVGKALRDGYRERVRLATKMPIRMVSVRNDLDRFFSEQLAKLQTDHIDFYLFHGLNRERWAKMKEVDALGWAEEKMDAGEIGHLGFSFHDDIEVFREIVDGYDGWTFCQIQYNYVDTEYQAGTRGLTYAASKGLAVVVMEPIQGGNLAVKPPDAIQAIWDEAKTQRTPADWALQWVWNHPEVSVVLSGMSTMDQVIENLESASRSGPATLTEEELAILSRVREQYLAIGFIGCTGCRYCVPCPEDVAIPEILALYNQHYARRGDPDAQQEITTKYGETVPPEYGAERCVKCGECEDKCPQQLPIRNLLTRAARSFNRPA